MPPVRTHEVAIDGESMPEGMEAELVRGIRNDLANAPAGNAGAQMRQGALNRLATLQGDVALDEKLHLILTANENFRSYLPVAMATTTNLQRQLDQLQSAWRDPAQIPRFDVPSAMSETRLIMANQPLEGWVPGRAVRNPTDAESRLAAAHQRDMEDLLASVPQRTGVSRTYAAYYLREFPGLTEAELQQAHEYGVEEFAHMDLIAQGMLLQTAHPPFRDPRLLPALKESLARSPGDRETVKAVLELSSGDEQKKIVTETVCQSGYPVQLQTLEAFHQDRVPEVDTCLAAILRPPTTLEQGQPPRPDNKWNGRVLLAARFASLTVLPIIRSGYVAPEQDSAMLAVLMRMAPTDAAALVESKPNISFYEAGVLYDSLHVPYPAKVLESLRTLMVRAPQPNKGSIAYQLSKYGVPADEAILEKCLTDLRLTWVGRESEVRSVADWQLPAGQAKAQERDLVDSLLRASAWKLDRAKAHAITDGCMSDECHRYAASPNE
jgi:hypothetical protein